MRFRLKTFLIPAVSFAAGVMATALAVDIKARHDYANQLDRIQQIKKEEPLGPDEALRGKLFSVSINEVSKKFVFAEPFEGSFQKTLTLSDGKQRTIRLRPLIHKNERVIALEDNGRTTYMGMNGTTTNGELMIQVRELNH